MRANTDSIRLETDGGQPRDSENVQIRLQEVTDELRAIESTLPEPLSLERAIEIVEKTAKAYKQVGNDSESRTDGGQLCGFEPIRSESDAMGYCWECQTDVPESDLQRVPSSGTLVDKEVVEHHTRDPITGERRDKVRRTEYEHTIPKCSDCRSEGGEQ